MFAVLALLICSSLLTFGAVLPNSWLALLILWLAGTALCFSFGTFQYEKFNLPFLAFLTLATAVFGFFQPRLAVGFVAAAWAWGAARRSQPRTLRFFHVLLLIGLAEALLGLVQFFVSP